MATLLAVATNPPMQNRTVGLTLDCGDTGLNDREFILFIQQFVYIHRVERIVLLSHGRCTGE